MTVSTTISEARFLGDGVATVFPLNFEVTQATDLEVSIIQSNGVTSPKTLNAEYTVSGLGQETGATVSLAFPLPVGEFLQVQRRTPKTQPISLLPNSGFSPKAVEDALDRMAMLVQEAANEFTRSISFPIGESGQSLPLAAQRANKLLGFNAEGEVIAAEAINQTLVSTLWQGILGDTIISDSRLKLFVPLYARNPVFVDADAIGAIGGANTGIYATNNLVANLPAGENGSNGHLLNLTFNQDVAFGYQLYFSPSGAMYRRGRNSGTYTAWQQVVTAAAGFSPAPRPITTSGIGQWVSLYGAPNTALMLPAGGTWAWHYTQRIVSTALHNGTSTGISAGGSLIAGANPNLDHWGFAWRIT